MITVIPAYEPDEKMIKLVKELLAETDHTVVIVVLRSKTLKWAGCA